MLDLWKYVRVGTTWNDLELPERNRIQLEPPGTRWTRQQTDSKNKKFIARNSVCDTTSQ